MGFEGFAWLIPLWVVHINAFLGSGFAGACWISYGKYTKSHVVSTTLRPTLAVHDGDWFECRLCGSAVGARKIFPILAGDPWSPRRHDSSVPLHAPEHYSPAHQFHQVETTPRRDDAVN